MLRECIATCLIKLFSITRELFDVKLANTILTRLNDWFSLLTVPMMSH